MNEQLLEGYTRDALAILRSSLNLARTTEPYFYRVAAVQMRILLCDTVRWHGQIIDTALLPKLMPDVTLRPLDTAGGIDQRNPEIELRDWLAQILPITRKPSVREFIRTVCDRHGGAHVDTRVNLPSEARDEEQRWILLLGEALACQIVI